MKKIIAPTDFSPIAENACIYAAQLAADIKAELLLFHTIELPLSVADYPVTEELFDEAGVEKELEALKSKCVFFNKRLIPCFGILMRWDIFLWVWLL